MGSFSLKEVFNKIGTPVFSLNLSMSAWYRGDTSFETVCSRPVPSTWVTAGITSRFSLRIGNTFSMKGTSSVFSKYSAVYSLRMEGANGRKLSLRLIFEFNKSFAFGFRGSANIDLAPNARGPNSARPENQPTTPGSISLFVILSNNCLSSNRWYFTPLSFNNVSTSSLVNLLPV